MVQDEVSRLQRIADGDQQALAAEYQSHLPRLRRMVQLRLDRRIQGKVDPSDVLQESFIDIAKRAEEYACHPSLPFFLWLRLITKQKLLEIHRRHLGTLSRDATREIAICDIGPEPSINCLASQLLGDLTSSSKVVEREEQRELLERILSTMDPVDREILSLRHFEELTNQECAELLQLTKTAASNRYVRALLRLKQKLAQIPGFLPAE